MSNYDEVTIKRASAEVCCDYCGDDGLVRSVWEIHNPGSKVSVQLHARCARLVARLVTALNDGVDE